VLSEGNEIEVDDTILDPFWSHQEKKM